MMLKERFFLELYPGTYKENNGHRKTKLRDNSSKYLPEKDCPYYNYSYVMFSKIN
jgi:hypothetical protein